MPYIVNFTDKDNKSPITVFDNTSNADTSLIFPGRNVTGYGQIIAENFLSLLENFAKDTQPINPIEGQLWYDTANGLLQVYDNTNWKAASGIQKSPNEPNVEDSNEGELWVDTINQQLRIYTGSRWLLVGPQESSIDGLRYGPAVENLTDVNGISKSVLFFYVADVPICIVSKDTFTPKIPVTGFSTIYSGFNIAQPADAAQAQEFDSIFLGGILPKLFGTASSAENLKVSGSDIPAARFVRNDVANTLEERLNVRSNAGITLGSDGNFNISTSTTAAKIYNSNTGSTIDIQTNRTGSPFTVVRVVDNLVGINNLDPQRTLDIDGDLGITGNFIVSNTESATNINNGSINVSGGVSIKKNLIVGEGIDIRSDSVTTTIVPASSDTHNLGSESQQWQHLYVKNITAENIRGTLSAEDGIFNGNSATATALKNTTSFRLAGDVSSQSVTFDGNSGGFEKTFNTVLSANIIADKDEPLPNFAEKDDFVLVYRSADAAEPSGGLIKQRRDTFVGDLGIPIGAILPFAGTNVPRGFLLCDGSEVEIAKYPDLYDIVGLRYDGSEPKLGTNTFRLPDLRGRFALGRHNMDNGSQVPLATSVTGQYVDGGGGEPSPARIEGTEVNILGDSGGQSSTTLILDNIPEHQHTLSADGIQYGAVKVDVASYPSSVTGKGPSIDGGAQYLETSGPVNRPDDFETVQQFAIMNPFLTLNYIIRSGPAAFETIF